MTLWDLLLLIPFTLYTALLTYLEYLTLAKIPDKSMYTILINLVFWIMLIAIWVAEADKDSFLVISQHCSQLTTNRKHNVLLFPSRHCNVWAESAL